MFRRTEDINSLKTRQIILQNPNGTFPANNQVLAISGTRGEVVKTSDLTLTSLTVSGDLTVMGDISANNVVTTITAGTGISVNGGATGAMSGAITITATGGTGSLPPGTYYSDYLYWNGTTWAVGSSSVHIGQEAGLAGQQMAAVAIGRYAGNTDQSGNAIAIGTAAGYVSQREYAVAIGDSAGLTGQREYAVAIGLHAGQSNQGTLTVAIGASAGNNIQGPFAIAIGREAGKNSQGPNSIAIGALAGQQDQSGNSIIINATGSALNGGATNACYIAPLRSVTAAAGIGTFVSLWYNTTTKELCYS